MSDYLRRALLLIGTKCANNVGAWTCVADPSRRPDAQYYAGRWCDQCIARFALEGGELPAVPVSDTEPRRHADGCLVGADREHVEPPADVSVARTRRPDYAGAIEHYLVSELTNHAKILRTVAAHIGAMESVDDAVGWLTAEAGKSQRMADETADAAWQRGEPPAEPTPGEPR